MESGTNTEVQMSQRRPTILNGKTGVGNFGVAVMPDGTTDTLRVLIKPDGFHFEAYDFDDLLLPSIALHSPSGTQYMIGFDDAGALLINGVKFVTDIAPLVSPNGTKYKIVVDDTGTLATKKETN